MKITPEAVKERIAALESAGELSLKEQFYLESLRQLVAAMDSEPVAWTDEQELRDVDRGGCGYLFTVNPVTPHADERRIILLYRHSQQATGCEQLAIENFRSAMEGIGHIRRTLEETFGGLHGTHVEPDVLAECKAICDAIYAAYGHAQPPLVPSDVLNHLEHEANHVTAWHHMDEHSCKVNRRDLLTLVNAIRNVQPQCTWTFSNYDDHWSGTCGVEWIFPDGGPEENGVKFCPKCGNNVAVSATEGTEE